MIRMLTGFPDDVLAVACEGHVTRRDYEDVLIPAVTAALQRHPKLRVYYEVTPQFTGIDAAAVWEDFQLGSAASVALGADGRRDRRRVDPAGDERVPLSAAGPAACFPDCRKERGAALDRCRRLLNVQENLDRQSRRDRLPHHRDGAADGDRDGGGLFRGRRRGAACTPGRRGGIDRPAAIGRQLSAHRPDRRRLPKDRRRGGASRLWVFVGAAGFRDGARRGRHRVHRAQPRGDRRDGRQDRLETAGARSRRHDRARPSRYDRRPRERCRDRR